MDPNTPDSRPDDAPAPAPASASTEAATPAGAPTPTSAASRTTAPTPTTTPTPSPSHGVETPQQAAPVEEAASPDAAETGERPALFPEGMQIGMHLTLERLLSTAPERTYYLANNFRPRWYTRICWSCGHKHNPTSAESCVYCQTPLRARRFLLSARWGADPRGFHAFASRRLRHAALACPIVLYQYGQQVLAFYELSDEVLLVDEPAPLHPRTLLSAAWTLAAGLAELHQQGIALAGLDARHVLVHKERARLFDPDIGEIRRRPIPPGDPAARADVSALGALLASVCPIDQPSILRCVEDAAEDMFPGPIAFQRELQRFARETRLPRSKRGAAALSVVGRTRPLNEDSWAWRRLGGADVYVVADGMGGYAAGDRASRVAVNETLRLLSSELPVARPTTEQLTALLERVCVAVNRAVVEVGAQAQAPAGTTLALAIVWPDRRVDVAHVGDSRIYRHGKAGLTPLTEDHSMVAAMVAVGKLTRDEARHHPRANVLLQYLGNATTPEPDVESLQLAPGEQLLLCSDGLWGEVAERDVAQLLDPSLEPRRQLQRLVTAANDAGGKDNITAVLVRLDAAPPA